MNTISLAAALALLVSPAFAGNCGPDGLAPALNVLIKRVERGGPGVADLPNMKAIKRDEDQIVFGILKPAKNVPPGTVIISQAETEDGVTLTFTLFTLLPVRDAAGTVLDVKDVEGVVKTGQIQDGQLFVDEKSRTAASPAALLPMVRKMLCISGSFAA